MKKNVFIGFLGILFALGMNVIGCTSLEVRKHGQGLGLESLTRIEIACEEFNWGKQSLGKLTYLDGKKINLKGTQKLYIPAGKHALKFEKLNSSHSQPSQITNDYNYDIEFDFLPNCDYFIFWDSKKNSLTISYIGHLVPKLGDSMLTFKIPSDNNYNQMVFVYNDGVYSGFVSPFDSKHELQICISNGQHTLSLRFERSDLWQNNVEIEHTSQKVIYSIYVNDGRFRLRQISSEDLNFTE